MSTTQRRRAVLVAHSGGNGASMEAAVAERGRVAAVLMVDPPSDSAFLPEEVRRGSVEGLAGGDSLEYLRTYYRTIAGEAGRRRRCGGISCRHMGRAPRAPARDRARHGALGGHRATGG